MKILNSWLGQFTKKPRFRPLVAVHLLLFKKEKILLGRRYNTGFEDGKYSVPAGHLEANESVIHAMIREAKEEIGIILLPCDLEVVHVMNRLSDAEHRIDFFLLAARRTIEPENKEPEKCDQLGWFDNENLPSNVIPYVKTALEHIKNGQYFSEFGYE